MTLLAVLGCLSARSAAAQTDAGTCVPPSNDWLEVYPASGATHVALDAPVRVRFTSGYFDDEARRAAAENALTVTLNDEFVRGSTSVVGDSLFFVPTDNWEASTTYSVAITSPALRELSTRFETGTTVDATAPQFDTTETSLAIYRSAIEPTCDDPDAAYRIDVEFISAVDDGALGDIEYLLYLTRADGLAAPDLRARTRNLSTDLSVMSFALSRSEASATACFKILAVDGVGNVSEPRFAMCFDPVTGNYFEPVSCAVPGPYKKAQAPFVFAALVLVCVWRRVRR